MVDRISLSGWNVYATRFVDAPVWSWDAPAAATSFRVQVATACDLAQSYRRTSPQFDMTPLWHQLPSGALDMVISGLDADGNEVCTALYKRFYKVPGFAGDEQEPLDWSAAVRANIAYLLAPARDTVAPYEQGMPRSCWSSFEDNISGQRTHLSYPALHHPSYIIAFLLFAEHFPVDALAAEAQRQARQYGDWLLENQLPAEWECGRFPYSTIENGLFEGGVEGRSITLFRAARAGEAMIALYRAFGNTAYLDYAHHLAQAFVRTQRADGSWPYRVDPQTGATVEEYTSNAITPARLFGLLEEITPSTTYAEARRRAANWVLTHPVQTKLWQGMYEDVGAQKPYFNLQHWDTNETIRYVLHYRDEVEAASATAARLNRYIEDQFVVWQWEESPVTVRCPTPTVLEQYLCYYPMEVHTGTWLLSLLTLHQATSEQEYLLKGVAAANAITHGQQPSGAFSTWGNDRRFGRPVRTSDWPGCNACATTALLHFNHYYRTLHRQEPFRLGLWGI